MTSYCMRNDTLFMRNTFSSTGKWGIPLVKKQNLPFPEIDLIVCSDTRANDDEVNRKKESISLLTITGFLGFITTLSGR